MSFFPCTFHAYMYVFISFFIHEITFSTWIIFPVHPHGCISSISKKNCMSHILPLFVLPQQQYAFPADIQYADPNILNFSKQIFFVWMTMLSPNLHAELFCYTKRWIWVMYLISTLSLYDLPEFNLFYIILLIFYEEILIQV